MKGPIITESAKFEDRILIWDGLLGYLKDLADLRVLDAGCCEGKMALWLLRNVVTNDRSSLEIICGPSCCDRQSLDEALADANTEKRLQAHVGEPADVLRALDTGTYDLVSISAIGSSESILNQAILGFELLKKNGLLVIGNISWRGAESAVKNPQAGLNAFLWAFTESYDIVYKNDHEIWIRKSCLDPLDFSI